MAAASTRHIEPLLPAGAPAATSLVHDKRTMRVLLTMCLSLLKYLPALP